MKKQIGEMTVSELKKYIRKLTRKANTRLKNINKRKKVSKAVTDEMGYLKKKGIIGKSGKAIYGFRGKRKADLQSQARELEYFNQWKGSETKAIAKKQDLKKYETFIQNNPEFSDYSYQDWEELVTMFGQMQDQLNSFGYEDMKQLHLESKARDTKKDFVTTMKKIHEQGKGKGLTQEDLVDLMRQELFA